MSLLDQARAQALAAAQQREERRLRQLGQSSTTPRLSPKERRERRSAAAALRQQSAPHGSSSSSSSGHPSKRKRERLEGGSAAKSAPGSIAKRAATHKNFMHEADFLDTATPIVLPVTAHPVTDKSGLAGWMAEVTTRRVHLGRQTFRVLVDFKARVFDPCLSASELDRLTLELTLRPARIGSSAIGWASKGNAADPEGNDYKFFCSAKVVQPKIILTRQPQTSAAVVVDDGQAGHHAILAPQTVASPQVPQQVNRPVVINSDVGSRPNPSRSTTRDQVARSDDKVADATGDLNSADESNDYRLEKPRSRPRSPVGARWHTRDRDIRARQPRSSDDSRVDRGFDADTEAPPSGLHHRSGDGRVRSRAVGAERAAAQTPQPSQSRHGADSELDKIGFIDPDAVKHLPDVADEECDDGPNSMFVWNLLVHFVLMIVLAGLFLLVGLHGVSLLQRLEEFLQLQGLGLTSMFGGQSDNTHGDL